MAYIYKITNQLNGKSYIGKTLKTVEQRWREHLKDSQKPSEEKRPLYSAIKKYGKINFTIEEIECCKDDEANEREIYWIQYFDTYSNGYNATKGGEGKLYYDRKILIETYQEVQNIKKAAEILNMDAGYLSKVLKENGVVTKTTQQIQTENYGKKVAIIENDNIIKTFPSIQAAAQYIKDSTNSTAELKGMSVHIRQAAQGKRKTAYKHKWQFIE